MTAGGKRQGAGRRAILTEWGRLRIGAECERIQAESKIDRTTLVDSRGRKVPDHVMEKLRVRHGMLREIPIADRKIVHELADRGELDDGDDDERVDIGDAADALSAVQVALDGASASGLSADDIGEGGKPVGRVFGYKRLRGKTRAEVTEMVASEFSAKYRIFLRASYVDECWKEYRAIERAISQNIEL